MKPALALSYLTQVLDLTALRDEVCRLVLRLLQAKKLKEVAGRRGGIESPFLECATRAKDENKALRSHILKDVKDGSIWSKRHMRTWKKSAFAASWGMPACPTLKIPFSNLMLNQKWSEHARDAGPSPADSSPSLELIPPHPGGQLLSWLKRVQARMMHYPIESPVWQTEGHFTVGQIVSVAIREWEADEGQSVKRLSVYLRARAMESAEHFLNNEKVSGLTRRWKATADPSNAASLWRRPRLILIKRSLARPGTTRANLLRLMLIGMAPRKLMRRVWPTNRSTFPSLGARP